MANKKISAKIARTHIIKPAQKDRLVRKRLFKHYYAAAALLILLVSTVFWATLSARIHSGNADQLVNPYLFDSSSAMRGAMLPGQHSFLLKWPVFFITKLYGESTASYELATVALSVLTVSSLAYIIHRIERRTLVKGTLFLALACVLFVIPAQPYPGGLLPVNMAMIATRNIEYVLYIACAWGIVRTKRLNSLTWVAACAGLILLIASDKLFLTLTLGAAVTACIVYAFRQRWSFASLSARWFITAAVGAVGALLVLGIIDATHITHITGQGNGPYGIIHTPIQLIHGLIGALSGLISNFGANPAFNTINLHDAPVQAVSHIFSFGGPALIINGLLLIGGLAASYDLLKLSLQSSKLKERVSVLSDSQNLALILLWTTLIAYGAFVATDHYYPVDARYLTIGLFSLFITMAAYTRTKEWNGKRLVIIGSVFVGAMLISIPMVINNYLAERAASFTIDSRNASVAQAISSHKVHVLVGDYWRVMPIKQISHTSTTVMPLSDCVVPRGILSSTVWQPSLQNNSFAYILSLDKSQTDYPSCSIDVVFSTYGKPNASVVIDGSIDHPKELLLFYDHGIHKSAPTNAATSPVSPTVEAIPIEDLPSNICSVPSSLNIVAHQDDDLLFMNPDIQKDIAAGKCVRTVYITAGDAGSNQFFWLGREQGSESAYSKMIGTDAIWIQRIVKLDENQFVTIANPKGNNKISVIFMHLPDGNIGGQGFSASHYESLQKLFQKSIPVMHSIYGNSTYTEESLTAALMKIMYVYQPAEIRTLATYVSTVYPDHSDHMTVSRFTDKAHSNYEDRQFNNNVSIPIKHYIGYPVHAMPVNVSGKELSDKTAVFLSYAKHDGSVCQTAMICATEPAFGSYLNHQYTQ